MFKTDIIKPSLLIRWWMLLLNHWNRVFPSNFCPSFGSRTWVTFPSNFSFGSRGCAILEPARQLATRASPCKTTFWVISKNLMATENVHVKLFLVHYNCMNQWLVMYDLVEMFKHSRLFDVFKQCISPRPPAGWIHQICNLTPDNPAALRPVLDFSQSTTTNPLAVNLFHNSWMMLAKSLYKATTWICSPVRANRAIAQCLGLCQHFPFKMSKCIENDLQTNSGNVSKKLVSCRYDKVRFA